jgi:hypothetical protein
LIIRLAAKLRPVLVTQSQQALQQRIGGDLIIGEHAEHRANIVKQHHFQILVLMLAAQDLRRLASLIATADCIRNGKQRAPSIGAAAKEAIGHWGIGV